MLMTTCLECGELSEQAHCPEHRPPEPPKHKPNNDKDYDWNWQKLSKRARRLQPFCSDCFRRDDLQADHSPEAWERKAAGKPIRLQDIDVVCGDCNIKRGPARGKNRRKNNIVNQQSLSPGGLGSTTTIPSPGPHSKFVLLSVSSEGVK